MRRKKIKPQIRKFRRFVLSIFMLGLLVLAVGRIGFIYMEKSDFYARQGDLRSVKRENIPALRGVIRDRNGEILALTTVLVSLGLDLEHLWIKPKASKSQKKRANDRISKFKDNLEFVAGKIGKSKKWLEDVAFNQDKKIKFKYIARELTPQVAEELKQRKVPALVYGRKLKRFYPKLEIGANLIGFADFVDKGRSGIEASFDQHLSGVEGKAWVRRDHMGNAIDYISLEQAATKGNNLDLSIDFRIQEITYFALMEAFKKHRAEKAAAVVLDVKTGAILAVESLPEFNPNDTKQRVSKGTRNVAIQDLYEPGSTMKPITVLAALEAGTIGKNQSLHIGKGKLKLAKNAIFSDSIKINAKDISLGTMLKKSSNVGAIKVGLSMKTRDHRYFLHQLGFGQRPDVKLYDSAKGVLRPANKINKVEHASMSFGHGFNTSVLQIAKAYLALANNGEIPKLSILKHDALPETTRVAVKENARHVRNLLKAVVSKEGTAPLAKVDGFTVAGKTGTSRKIINGKYSDKRHVSLFAGMIPADDPRLVIVVLIDDPKGKYYYGGRTAAPVFSKIAAKTLAYLGIKPDKSKTSLLVLKAADNE